MTLIQLLSLVVLWCNISFFVYIYMNKQKHSYLLLACKLINHFLNKLNISKLSGFVWRHSPYNVTVWYLSCHLWLKFCSAFQEIFVYDYVGSLFVEVSNYWLSVLCWLNDWRFVVLTSDVLKLWDKIVNIFKSLLWDKIVNIFKALLWDYTHFLSI